MSYATPDDPPPGAGRAFEHEPTVKLNMPGERDETTLLTRWVPLRNPPALIAYYLAIFGLIPGAGLLLGPAALACGCYGMRRSQLFSPPVGFGHAVFAVVCGMVDFVVSAIILAVALLYWLAATGPGQPGGG